MRPAARGYWEAPWLLALGHAIVVGNGVTDVVITVLAGGNRERSGLSQRSRDVGWEARRGRIRLKH